MRTGHPSGDIVGHPHIRRLRGVWRRVAACGAVRSMAASGAGKHMLTCAERLVAEQCVCVCVFTCALFWIVHVLLRLGGRLVLHCVDLWCTNGVCACVAMVLVIFGSVVLSRQIALFRSFCFCARGPRHPISPGCQWHDHAGRISAGRVLEAPASASPPLCPSRPSRPSV